MKIEHDVNPIKLSGTEPQEKSVRAEQSAENNSGNKKVSFFAGNLNFGQSRVDKERQKAKEAAKELVDRVWKNDASMDADAKARTENVKKLKEENLDHAKMMKDIREEIEALEKVPSEQRTLEEQKKLEELKVGLEGYKESEYLNKKEIHAENAAVRGMRIERLKHHDMIDANLQGEEITEASEKNVIGICMEETKEKQKNDLQEMKEAAKEEKAKEEYLEEKIAAARERREEAREKSGSEEEETDAIYELDQTLEAIKKEQQNQNLPDMKKSMEEVVSEMKIAAEDLKGLIVDSDV